jgi:hypothetical protein
MKTTTLLAIAATTQAFTTSTNNNVRTQTTALNMGLFDGVKEAFGSSGMGDLDAERETPIDRWMGWNTKSVDAPQAAVSKGELCILFVCFSFSSVMFVFLSHVVVTNA